MHVRSVNVARSLADRTSGPPTGFDKHPTDDAIEVRDPGPKRGGLGSALVGDLVGDPRHHGGSGQAVYAVAREVLDHWSAELGRDLSDGAFGENLTTSGADVDGALLGERWLVGGDVVLQVTYPRIPCNTFRERMDVPGWLRRFTLDARPGAYFSVVRPGRIRRGDPIEVVHRPDHDITVALAFRATTTERELLPRLLDAGDDLGPELRSEVATG